ncbi:MAG: LmeA family phospholipid-binding protein [Cyanobacteria bacterium P01_A01_bin.105]
MTFPQHRIRLDSRQRRRLLQGAVGLMLTVGCTPSGLVERQIEGQLPNYLGPAERYDVDIQGLRVRANAADRLIMVGERMRPEGSPIIDRLTVELEGIQYDREAGQLTQVLAAGATARVAAADLAAFVAQDDNIRTAAIALTPPNQLTLNITPEVGRFPIPDGIALTVTGELLGSGSQVQINVTEVRAAGFNVSGVAAQQLNRSLNPLVDLSDLPVALTVASVTVDGESLRLAVVGDPASFSRAPL